MRDEMGLRRIASKISNYFPAWLSRGRILFLLIALGLSILIIPAFLMERSSKKDLNTLKLKLKDLAVLSSEYMSRKERIDTIEKRISLTKVSGITEALDKMFSSLGIKGKMKSVKVTGEREMKGAITEELAQVMIEQVNMNELVNLFFKVENTPMMLSIKKVRMKKSFETPELLDVTMTIALYTAK